LLGSSTLLNYHLSTSSQILDTGRFIDTLEAYQLALIFTSSKVYQLSR
jgi:hypothetical protein